jgi:predicted CopG family antitoxin
MKEILRIKSMDGKPQQVKTRHITVLNEVYLRLKEIGKFGDTYNDIVTSLLEVRKKSD